MENIKNVVVLTIITVISGFLLGYVYNLTKLPIADSEKKATEEAYKAVFEKADHFEADSLVDLETAKSVLDGSGFENETIEEVLAAYDSDGNKAGYVFKTTTNEGYGGNITMSVGIMMDGTVTGLKMLSISETAGLGMKATTDSFTNQFKDKNVANFSYTKTGSKEDYEIDALSGATITTNAVTDAVNATIKYFEFLKENADKEVQ